MTEADAFAYMEKDMFEEIIAPNTWLVNASFSLIAA